MNKIVRFWLLAALAFTFFVPQPARAAAADYDFGVSLGTYSDISGEAGYTVSTAAGDDGAENITLPFTFNYDTVDYITGRISVNGWLEMGQTYTGGGYTNALDSTEAKPLLAPLWDDLLDDASSEIGYVTLGSAPNRVFVVQWKNVLWPVGEGRTPQNFQVRLYETTNVIEFVYGAMNAPGSAPSASIGINDATGGSGHFLSVTPAAGTADTVSSTTANNSITSAAHLTSGKTYTFTPLDPNAPPSCAVNVGPADGATDVVLNTALNWRSGGGVVTGYRLHFGTDNPPTNIVNGTDLGNVTTYNPAGSLTVRTTYYWQVVSYNTNGDAPDCAVWSFTTGASVATDLLNESFTGATFPPSGWAVSSDGVCAWSRVTDGTYPTQAPYSPPSEAKFNSYDCSTGNFKQLISPVLDFSTQGNYSLSFWMYHDTLYAGNFPDRLQVQVSLDGGSTFADVGAEISRYTGLDEWRHHEIDLSAYAGESAVNVVIRGISGYGSNMFVDDVQVIANLPVDVPNCAAPVSPADGASGVPVVAGLNWADGGGIPAGYKISFGTDNPPTNIADSTDLGRVTTYAPSALLAGNTPHYWQIVPYNSFGDAEACPVWSFTTGAAPLAAFPYVEGFEGGAGGWTSGGGNSSWELGTPAGAVIIGASTGDTAWATNLDGDYNNEEQSYVLSPFFDFSGLDFPYVKFDLWWDAETSYDGAQLQASADGGATWQVVGAQGDGFNWYNEVPDGLGVNADGWSGDIESDEGFGGYSAAYGWRTTMHDLSDLANEPSVRFRFFFGANDDVTYDGFAFDNFEIRSGCAWTGAVDADWHTAGNWDCSHVPGAEEIVMLPYDDSVAVPLISEDAAAAAVGVDYDLILDGGNLTARYVYEYGLVYIAEGYEVNLIGSGNAWEATWETMDYWDDQWSATTNGRVRFSGPGMQRIVHDYDGDYFTTEDYAQFYNVVIENGAQVQSASNLQVANDLTVNQGSALDMGAFELLVGGVLTNNGTLRQQQNVNGAPVTFFGVGGYGGLALDPGSQDLGWTTTQIHGNQDCTTVPGETLKRCFNITPGNAPGSGVAFTFYFTAADLPVGHTCSAVELYHWDGAWSSALTRDSTYETAGRQCTTEPYSIRVTGVSDFSPFVLTGSGEAPTAVSVQRLHAVPGFVAVSGLVLGVLAVYGTNRLRKTALRKRRKHSSVAPDFENWI